MHPNLAVFPILFFHADLFAEVCQLPSFRSDFSIYPLHLRRYSHIFIDVNHLNGHAGIWG